MNTQDYRDEAPKPMDREVVREVIREVVKDLDDTTRATQNALLNGHPPPRPKQQ